MDAVGQTDIIRTGGDKPLIHPLMTEIAFLGNVPLFIEIDGMVRTRLNTGPTARTQLIIHDHNTVIPF